MIWNKILHLLSSFDHFLGNQSLEGLRFTRVTTCSPCIGAVLCLPTLLCECTVKSTTYTRSHSFGAEAQLPIAQQLPRCGSRGTAIRRGHSRHSQRRMWSLDVSSLEIIPSKKKVSNWVSSPTTGITPLRVLTNQAYEMLLTINQFLRDDPPSGAYPQGYSSYLVFRGKTAPWRLVGILGLDGLGCMATALLPQGI